MIIDQILELGFNQWPKPVKMGVLKHMSHCYIELTRVECTTGVCDIISCSVVILEQKQRQKQIHCKIVIPFLEDWKRMFNIAIL